MKAKELRTKEYTVLGKLLQKERAHAQEMRFEITMGERKQHRTYRAARREIARITTIMGEKKKEEEQLKK